MTKRFHLGMSVSDLPRSTAFYRNCLDFEVGEYFECGEECDTAVGITGSRFVAQFLHHATGLSIELLRFAEFLGRDTEARRPMNRIGFTHVSIGVPYLDKVIGSTERYGGSVLHETRSVLGGVDCVYLLDPDGNSIQISQTISSARRAGKE